MGSHCPLLLPSPQQLAGGRERAHEDVPRRAVPGRERGHRMICAGRALSAPGSLFPPLCVIVTLVLPMGGQGGKGLAAYRWGAL